MFDVETSSCVFVFEGHTASVNACAWSVAESNGRLILSGSADKTLRVWDSQTGGCEQVLRGHQKAVVCAEWSEAEGGCCWVLNI